MVSPAERRLAAKQKLQALAEQRREDRATAESERQEREAAKAAKQARRQEEAAARELEEQCEQREAPDAPKGQRKAAKPPAAPTAKSDVTSRVEERSGWEGGAAAAKERRPKKGKSGRREPVPVVPISQPAALGADAYREAHNIVCKNEECLEPVQTFEAAQGLLGEHLVEMLRGRDFLAPAPIQAQVWPLALGGRDIVGIAQTGSGKTLAYLLPALVRLKERGEPSTASLPALPRVLVLAPTRELTQQIASETAKLAISIGHRFVPCFGGVWKGAQLKQLEKGCDLLLSTPGRAKDFMLGVSKKKQPPAVSVAKVSYLVLDEADAMLSMGFMPQIKDIVRQCVKAGKPAQGFGAGGPEAGTRRQTLFFTATWPRRVRAAARELTVDAAQLRIGQGVGADKLTANKNVRQIVQVVEHGDKLKRLVNVLTTELMGGDTCIVFCSTRGRVDFIVDSLRRAKIADHCEGIHSGKDQWERDKILQRFRDYTAAAKERAVLVATDVAARGIDIPGVALVVVYDLNGWNGELSIDSYVHRIGRTGRAGKMGRAYTFVSTKDRGLPDLVRLLKDAEQRVPLPLQEVEIGERLPVKTKRKRIEEEEETPPKARRRDKTRRLFAGAAPEPDGKKGGGRGGVEARRARKGKAGRAQEEPALEREGRRPRGAEGAPRRRDKQGGAEPEGKLRRAKRRKPS